MDATKAPFRVDLLSDGTGETALAVLKAVLIQYDEKVPVFRHKNIRSREQIENIFKKITQSERGADSGGEPPLRQSASPQNGEAEAAGGEDAGAQHGKGEPGANTSGGPLSGKTEAGGRSLLIYTAVLSETRQIIQDLCEKYQVRGLDLLGGLIQVFDSRLKKKAKKPGILRSVNEDYFNRIEAMEFSLRHDDGRAACDLKQADIILTGVSRTGKTPLSLFLSYKGWKTANVPIIYNMSPPKEIFEADKRKIIALTIDPDCLFKIRKNRLEKFGSNVSGSYADRKQVYMEAVDALSLFQKHKWPVLNVTDKALEETAGEIERILSKRRNIQAL